MDSGFFENEETVCCNGWYTYKICNSDIRFTSRNCTGCSIGCSINDLPATVTKSFTGVCCDDTLIAKEISQISDTVELQKDLDNIYEWTQKWGMKFNTVKCVQMTVSNKQNLIRKQYFLGKEKLISKD